MDLNSSIKTLPSVGPVYLKRLSKLGIETVGDLLHHVPHRYIDYRLLSKISAAQPGEILTLRGKVEFIKNQYTRYGKKIQIAEVSDSSGRIKVIWFNQPYLVMNIKKGQTISLSGKVELFSNQTSLISPEYEIQENNKESIHTGRLVPIYPVTSGLSSKWIRAKIYYLLKNLKITFDDLIPKDDLKNLKLVEINRAFDLVHYPENISDPELGIRRLAFDELLVMHIKGLLRKSEWGHNTATHKLNINPDDIKNIIDLLPYKLTNSQEQSIKEILDDLKKSKPMNRLLEGDVGSGKTVVAAVACFASFLNGYQSVIMAPTQILAQQHFQTLNNLFSEYKVRVKLITGAGERGDLGLSDIYVGTHALIHRVIDSRNVALVVIDEQHRFGVEQRTHLIKKVGKRSKSPHVLTMTATPIPRTVALTVYGDLDLSILSDMPEGRIPVKTWIVPPQKRTSAYSWINNEIEINKIQAFIICPLIEESQIETMKEVRAVTKEYDRLTGVFKNLKLGLLHGKLKAQEKENTITEFKNGNINILVSTPVVEVGIDVPNATIMLIEGSERFGLAQLHQLRGRVGRGSQKSYCLLFTQSHSRNVLSRLNALTKSYSGFELAEMDLKFRGPGEIFGTHQHGFFDLKIASWKDEVLISKSKNYADNIIDNKGNYTTLLNRLMPTLISPN